MNYLGSPLELFTRHMFTEIIQKLSAYLAENKFSMSEVAALHVVGRTDGISVQNLSSELNLSVSATSRLISGLVRKQLFTRKTDPKDARTKIIKCSKKGEALLNEMSLARVSTVLQVAQSLPSEMSRQILKAVSLFKQESGQ